MLIRGISTQALYQHRQRYKQCEQDLMPIRQWVQSDRRLMPRIGGRKLYHLIKLKLNALKIKLGRDGFFTSLSKHVLLVKPKRSYTKTTMNNHWMYKHPNLIKDTKPPTHPERVLLADITYIKSKQAMHYLSLVTDAYSRKIMGYHLSHEMPATQVVKALNIAVNNKQYGDTAIHNSDRGLQYCSYEYQSVLAKAHITPSMTDGYDCYQNALAEWVNGILKQEFLLYECNLMSRL